METGSRAGRLRVRAVGRSLLTWLALTVLLFALLGAIAGGWLLLGSAFYTQNDDLERLVGKRAYLQRVAAKRLRRSSADGGRLPPNVVLILFDDLGYGDLGSYGARSIRTPELDRLAEEGVRLTDYYAPAPVCSPSRAGLLTGRYPVRTRLVQVPMTSGGSPTAPLAWAPLHRLQRATGQTTRLPAEEITLAEALAAAGYATGIFGKWHLGLVSPSLPNDLGFDVFHGLLSSNDQLPNPFYRNREVVEETPVDQTTLTRRYTDAALDFIESHRDRPFFVYLPHTFPHRPLHVAEERRGRSAAGLYGDVVEELDENVGRVVAALRRLALAENTLVLVTSDNGPWFQGSSGGRRGRKTDLFEGGFAVPFIAWWPGTLPAGAVRSEMTMGIDVFPTVLGLAGIELPTDRVIDGRDIMALLRDGAPSPHDALFFYWASQLGAVRSGAFKYHIRRPIRVGYALAPLMIQMPLGPWLFDLGVDADESYDVGDRHPEVRERLARVLAERVGADERNVRGWITSR